MYTKPPWHIFIRGHGQWLMCLNSFISLSHIAVLLYAEVSLSHATVWYSCTVRCDILMNNQRISKPDSSSSIIQYLTATTFAVWRLCGSRVYRFPLTLIRGLPSICLGYNQDQSRNQTDQAHVDLKGRQMRKTKWTSALLFFDEQSKTKHTKRKTQGCREAFSF